MEYSKLKNGETRTITNIDEKSHPIGFSNPKELLNSVCEAAERGWKIFPVLTRSRHSLDASAMIGHATSDLDQIENWANHHPGCNWALATGPDSGVLAVEFGGAAAVASLNQLLSADLEEGWNGQTLTLRAGWSESDTVATFFQWPVGLTMRGSLQNIAPRLWLRGAGDHLLLPPSIRLSGARYFYTNIDAGIAPAPQWLIDRFFEMPGGVSESYRRKFPPLPVIPYRQTSSVGRE